MKECKFLKSNSAGLMHGGVLIPISLLLPLQARIIYGKNNIMGRLKMSETYVGSDIRTDLTINK